MICWSFMGCSTSIFGGYGSGIGEGFEVSVKSPESKFDRKAVHDAVRSHLKHFESGTLNDQIRIFYSGKKNKMNKTREEKYVAFTLHKQNIDTSAAIYKISRSINKRPNDFFVAGNKDKRGVTTQLVVCRKLAVDHLMRFRLGKNWPTNIEVCCFKVEKEGLHIGDLYGNRFKLALRIFSSGNIDEAEIKASIQKCNDRRREVG